MVSSYESALWQEYVEVFAIVLKIWELIRKVLKARTFLIFII
jgi:hypothetical protein